MTNLTDQQQAGIEKIRNWYDECTVLGDGGVFRLFGPAGTGKTTMAKEIPAALGLDRVRYGTYTGKAAHVLRTKGAAPVSTIHSGIYFPTTSAEALARLRAAEQELEDAKERRDDLEDYVGRGELTPMPGDGLESELRELHVRISELEAEIRVLQAEARRMSWEWNPMSEWADADLFILDEVSMVGPKLAADIEAYGVPVLVLGDPAQLPPVDGGGYYTEATPDHLLTEIHRQALESPVLELATRIRTSTGDRFGLTGDDLSPASVARALEFDQVLCWSNKRRWALITVMRRMMGRPEGVVVTGDRVMCLANNKDLAVFNGQQFQVLEVTPGTLGPTLRLRDDEGHTRTIPVYADGFAGQEMQDQAKKSGAGWKGGRMLATFANAITVHKAQGSEWPSVYVVNETPAMVASGARRTGREDAVELARRWLYTAVSRASDRVTITGAR